VSFLFRQRSIISSFPEDVDVRQISIAAVRQVHGA